MSPMTLMQGNGVFAYDLDEVDQIWAHFSID
jgi:hypothetical protein